jgi:hypothetical protein
MNCITLLYVSQITLAFEPARYVHGVEYLFVQCSHAHWGHQNRYEAFMRMVRQWRHLKMLKRAGRGHDLAGVGNTKLGECALLCPACPQPGKNLPDDWQDVPKVKQ